MKPPVSLASRRAGALRRRLPAALIVFAAWTAYGVGFAHFVHAWRARQGLPTYPFRGVLSFHLLDVWLWALLTPVIVGLARRFTVSARRVWNLPLHIGFAVGLHVVHALAQWALRPHVGAGPRAPLADALVGNLFFDGFVYVGVVAIVHAIDAQGQAMRLRTELLESELRLLRMQLQPHFLFNTLNAVSELVHTDPARAERALARLGDLLRWSLQSSALREVSLREELAALDHYLEIQRLRHGEGLALRVDAAADTLGLAVPGLLLQPLVENAIRHGVRGAARGAVTVTARRDGARLVLEVRDDGRGVAAGWREGTGLRATRARLEGLYGADQRFELRNGGGGTLAAVTLPARPHEPAAGEPAP